MENNNREVFIPKIGWLTLPETSKILLNIIFMVDISGSMREEGRMHVVNEVFLK